MSRPELTTPERWRDWLRDDKRDVLAHVGDNQYLLGELTSEQRESGWLRFAPADEAMLQAVEARIGQPLPPS